MVVYPPDSFMIYEPTDGDIQNFSPSLFTIHCTIYELADLSIITSV